MTSAHIPKEIPRSHGHRKEKGQKSQKGCERHIRKISRSLLFQRPMTGSTRVGTATSRVVPGTASRLLASAMQNRPASRAGKFQVQSTYDISIYFVLCQCACPLTFLSTHKQMASSKNEPYVRVRVDLKFVDLTMRDLQGDWWPSTISRFRAYIKTRRP